MTQPLDHHAALIYAMVTMSVVDRAMSDAELARIGELVSNLPIFADFDQEKLVKTAQACGEVLSEDGGLDRVLILIRSALPKKIRETAYAVALEVAAADLNVKSPSASTRSSTSWPTSSASSCASFSSPGWEAGRITRR